MALKAEADAAAQLQPLRDQEAAKGAVLARFKIEQDNLEREAQRTADRQRELEARAEQLNRDMAREETLIGEAKETLERLEAEIVSLANTARLAADFEQKALAAHDQAETALAGRRDPPQRAHHRGGRGTRAPAEPGDGRRASAATRSPSSSASWSALEAQTREIVGRAPDASKLKAATELGQQLMAEIASIEAAHAWPPRKRCRRPPPRSRRRAPRRPRPASPPASSRPRSRRWPSCLRPPATAACRRSSTPSRSRKATRWRSPRRWATTSTRRPRQEAPLHWRLNAAAEPDPALPAGVEPLVAHVAGPPELTRRLRQIGVVDAADGARLQRLLKPGQRLVSGEGHLWRWDGFVAAAQVSTAAASRLAERSRLGALAREEAEARRTAEAARAAAEAAAEPPARDAGRGAPPAPAVARGAGQAGADPRRAHRHGAAGARDGSQDRRRRRRPQPRPGGAGRGAHAPGRDRGRTRRRWPARKGWRPSWRRRRRRRPGCARASARAAPSSSRWSASIGRARSGRRRSASSRSAGARARPAPRSRSRP